jgi:hypothetical protein
MANLPKGIRVRQATPNDIPNILTCLGLAYPSFNFDMESSARLYAMEMEMFPQGQSVAVIEDSVVGVVPS